jgi:hypothetical protein
VRFSSLGIASMMVWTVLFLPDVVRYMSIAIGGSREEKPAHPTRWACMRSFEGCMGGAQFTHRRCFRRTPVDTRDRPRAKFGLAAGASAKLSMGC